MSAAMNHDRIATSICRTVAEIPDRSSPDNFPEAMLVTADELHTIVVCALENEAESVASEPRDNLLTDANPSAFPHQPMGSDGLPEVEAHYGMTLRDHFAGQALSGLMAAEAPDVIYTVDGVAGRAYRIADAMLAARKDAPHG